MAKAGKGEAPKTNAMRELDRAGIDYEVHAYEIEDETTVGIGQRVAQVTGIDEHAAFKTLVCVSPRKTYAVFCIPVADELDLKKAARAAGSGHDGDGDAGAGEMAGTMAEPSGARAPATTRAVSPSTPSGGIASATPGGTGLDRLTRREQEVLELMAQGLSNAQIAERLVVSDGAVAKHVANIFRGLDLQPGEENRRVRAVLAWLHARA